MHGVAAWSPRYHQAAEDQGNASRVSAAADTSYVREGNMESSYVAGRVPSVLCRCLSTGPPEFCAQTILAASRVLWWGSLSASGGVRSCSVSLELPPRALFQRNTPPEDERVFWLVQNGSLSVPAPTPCVATCGAMSTKARSLSSCENG